MGSYNDKIRLKQGIGILSRGKIQKFTLLIVLRDTNSWDA